MKERILVCVSNPKHAEKLIQRGQALASAFQGECLVLSILDRPYNELDYHQLQTRCLFENLCRKHRATLISCHSKGRKVIEVITTQALESKVTQIVIGQPPKTRFELAFRHSLINGLLHSLDGVDLHVVQVNRVFHYESEDYERGINAYWVRDLSGGALSFALPDRPDVVHGVFFKDVATEFDHGHFVVQEGEQLQVYPVIDGRVQAAPLNSALEGKNQ